MQIIAEPMPGITIHDQAVDPCQQQSLKPVTLGGHLLLVGGSSRSRNRHASPKPGDPGNIRRPFTYSGHPVMRRPRDRTREALSARRLLSAHISCER